MLTEKRKAYLKSLFPGREVEGFASRNQYDVIKLKSVGKFRGELNATINVWIKNKQA